jgi:2-dehydropantoate 2-reductase
MQNIVVMGAGHIGCYVGARLASAGAAVQLVGRPRVLAEVLQHGLGWSDLRGGQGHAEAAAFTLAQAPGAVPADALVLVSVKSGATEAVGHQLAACLLPGTTVLSLQNGLFNAERLAALLPQCTVLAGMVPFNVVPLGTSRYHQATQGRLEAQAHAALVPWLPLFERAGLSLTQHADIKAVQWGKLLLNLNNPINALSGLPVKAMLMQRDYRRCMALAQEEAVACLHAAGLKPARMTPVAPRWMPSLLRLPNAVFLRLAQRMLAMDPHARASMADDLDKGRVSEVDFINGEVVRLGQAHGVATPVNARLVALMRQAEAGGQRQWAAPDLLATLRQARRVQR